MYVQPRSQCPPTIAGFLTHDKLAFGRIFAQVHLRVVLVFAQHRDHRLRLFSFAQEQ
jgi:hypothetical protein